jgi:hypothetical protein
MADARPYSTYQGRAPPDYEYRELEDVVRGATGSQHALWAVVAEATEPRPTRGTDLAVSLRLEDWTTTADRPGGPLAGGVTLMVFAPDAARLPAPRRPGDVLRLHRVRYKPWSGRPQLVGALGKQHDRFAFALWDGGAGAPGALAAARAQPYQVSSNTFFFDAREAGLLEGYRQFSASGEWRVGGPAGGAAAVAAADQYRKKIFQLGFDSPAPRGVFFDMVAKVLAVEAPGGGGLGGGGGAGGGGGLGGGGGAGGGGGGAAGGGAVRRGPDGAALTSTGFPRRPGASPCASYAEHLSCPGGAACPGDHPEPPCALPPSAAAAAAAAEAPPASTAAAAASARPVVWVWDGTDLSPLPYEFWTSDPDDPTSVGALTPPPAVCAPAAPALGGALPVVFPADEAGALPAPGQWVRLRNCAGAAAGGQPRAFYTKKSAWRALAPAEAAEAEFAAVEELRSRLPRGDVAAWGGPRRSAADDAAQPFTTLRRVAGDVAAGVAPTRYRVLARLLDYTPSADAGELSREARTCWSAAEAEGYAPGDALLAAELYLEDATGARVEAALFGRAAEAFFGAGAPPADAAARAPWLAARRAALEAARMPAGAVPAPAAAPWLDLGLEAFVPADCGGVRLRVARCRLTA